MRQVCLKADFLISDDSGCWGQGGLFSALSRRSSQPETRYELAGKMKGIVVALYFVVCFQNYSMAFLDDCHEIGRQSGGQTPRYPVRGDVNPLASRFSSARHRCFNCC